MNFGFGIYGLKYAHKYLAKAVIITLFLFHDINIVESQFDF
jgi:hypothetical protein